jgi:hypothetical protein
MRKRKRKKRQKGAKEILHGIVFSKRETLPSSSIVLFILDMD